MKVSGTIVSYTLMVLGGQYYQIAEVVAICLWLISQVSQVDLSPQVNVHMLSKLCLFRNVAYC